MQSYVLRITSNLLFVTFIYFIIKSNRNIHELFIGSIVLLLFFCSHLFWRNPVRHSIAHKIDAIVAKTTIIYSILYTTLVKNLNKFLFYSYLLIVFCIGLSFYMSNYYSKKEWCSPHHIYYHFILHICCFVGSLYAFF